MLVTWFPLTTLLHQQSEIDATAAQISALHQQEQSLHHQARSLDSSAAATRLAREQYQLVNPGQSLIQVMPGMASGGAPESLDPGFQPLVSPTAVQPLLSSVGPVASRHASTNGFFSRLVRTLEFWR